MSAALPFSALIAEHREFGLVIAVVLGFCFGFVLERAGFGRADKLAAQHLNLGIESDDRLLAIDFNDIVHGFTPCSSSQFRMLATAPLSVSGDGCGR